MNKLARNLTIGWGLILFVAAADVRASEPNPLEKAGWVLVFNDEFDGPALDYYNSDSRPTGKWLTTPPWHRAVDEKNLAYYIRYETEYLPVCDDRLGNHVLTGSTLKLVVKEEPGQYDVWHFDPWSITCEPFDYTSGMIQSKRDFLYGYFEIRCKIPNEGLVLWPAFWLWAGDCTYREIDCFEFGGCTSNKVGLNLHIQEDHSNPACYWKDELTGGPAYPYINCYPGSFVITDPPNVTDAFHTYAVDWTPDEVIWYVDNVPVYTVTGHSPRNSQYIVANLAIAPWWPPTGNVCGIDLTDFPYEFEIDYIRAYKKATINKGPYLQNVTQSSIVVMWETNGNPTSSRLRYRDQTGGGWLEVSNATSVELHELMITGLDT